MSSPGTTQATSNLDKTNSNMWEERWAQGRTGWDQGDFHPALVELLVGEGGKKGDDLGLPTEGRGLVPGCGMGWDVWLLSKRGLDAVGLDISQTGMKAAAKWVSDQPETTGRSQICLADFFEYDPEEKFDVILDYTFLCALPPPVRPKWSSHLTHLSAPKPSTRLITLMFPLDGPPGGPPYSLTVADYHDLLDGSWELVHLEDVPENKRRKKGPQAGEKLGVWKRRLS